MMFLEARGKVMGCVQEGRAEGKPGAVRLPPAAPEKWEGREGLGHSGKKGQVWWEHRTPAGWGWDGRPVSSLITSSIATIIKNSCNSAYVVIPTKGETDLTAETVNVQRRKVTCPRPASDRDSLIIRFLN